MGSASAGVVSSQPAAKFESLQTLVRDALNRRSTALPPVPRPDDDAPFQLVEVRDGVVEPQINRVQANGRLLLPLSVHDLMDREIQSLKVSLEERDVALAERVEEIERMQRHIDVLEKALESEKRRR